MFADPQSVTVNAVAKSLAKVDGGNYRGTYSSAADGLTLTVQHSKGKRNRSAVTLKSSKLTTDPYVPATNRNFEMVATLSINVPEIGFSSTEVSQIAQALIDWADTPANLAKFVNGES